MQAISWQIMFSGPDQLPWIQAEYLLDQQGIFMKREKRLPLQRPLAALTGFRVGYQARPGTDYRAAPMDRMALIWPKITAVRPQGKGLWLISGNLADELVLRLPLERQAEIMSFIEGMLRRNPPQLDEDETAAAWLCWRDDDDWGDPFLTLTEMVAHEAGAKRLLEPEILAATRLASLPRQRWPQDVVKL